MPRSKEMAMNFNVSAWSIRNPVPAILLFIVLCLLGVTSFMRLPITQFPNIDIPLIAVSVSQSGAAPAELETQVTKRIEDSVSSITGVKHIVSTMADGRSTTLIEFRLEIPTDKALEDVKDAVSKIRSDLPGGIDEPIIQRIDVEGQSIQTYAASAPAMNLEQLSWHIDDVVKRELQGLQGVGRVDRYGGVDREIRVDLDPGRLQALGVTAADVNRQLNATNADLGAGRGEVGGSEQAIRTLGGARTLEELRQTKIALPGGRQLRLEDVATVTDSTEEPRSFARHNGDSVVTFSIFRAKGASAKSVGDRVAASIEKLQKASPDVKFELVDDTVYFIYGNYISAMATLLEGALLAVLVVLIFLKDWRATLISAIALPLSAIPTFWAMSQMGFSLNLVSFLGITLATGILVDDAIVEIENIARHMRMGKSPYRAALDGADEIGLAVIAISFTIIAVFVPVSFMNGVVGQYFKQFGMTVAVAVTFSLLVARLITPMMAAYLLRPTGQSEHQPGALLRGYIKLLRFTNWAPTIHRKPRIDASGHEVPHVWRPRIMSYVTIAASVGILMASISLTQYLPTGFIPRGDESRFVLSVELPPGSQLKDTLVATEKMAAHIKQHPEVVNVFVLGGSTPTGALEPRYASIFVNLVHKQVGLVPGLINPIVGRINEGLGTDIPLVPFEGRIKPQWDIESEILPALADIPDIRWAKITDRGTREIEFNMLSNDPAALDVAIAKLETALREEPMLRAVAAQGGLLRPEIKIKPKSEEAARLGISAQQISQAVRVATIGDFGPALAKYNAGDRLLPIRVQIPEKARTDFSEITSLKIMTSTGTAVPLSSVADITFSRGPSSIKRFDRQRQATIGADIVPGVELGEASTRILEIAKASNLPAAVKLTESGDAEIQGEIFGEFQRAAGLGVVLMLGILVLLLGNIFQPFAIILSLPLSIGGVVIALLATNKSFSMPVVIGMLMLMGIVAKNAIMLIDFAVERVKHGLDRMEAIIDAGRKRARPIIMTTIAMAAGMLPSAFGIGEGGDFRSPMAIGVIGGLIASTVLSLVFVPSFYIVMDDLAHLTRWLLGRFIGASDEPIIPDTKLDELHASLAVTNAAIEELDEKIDRVEEAAARQARPGKAKLAIAAE
jgi:multidrug efflux pump subunit AcrB